MTTGRINQVAVRTEGGIPALARASPGFTCRRQRVRYSAVRTEGGIPALARASPGFTCRRQRVRYSAGHRPQHQQAKFPVRETVSPCWAAEIHAHGQWSRREARGVRQMYSSRMRPRHFILSKLEELGRNHKHCSSFRPPTSAMRSYIG